MEPARKGTRSRWRTPYCLRHPVGVLFVPGQVLYNLQQLYQRLTDQNRPYRLIQPRPNEATNTLKKPIEWDIAHEQVASQVKEFIAAPISIPAFPAYTQQVESAVKKLTLGNSLSHER